MVKSLRLMIQIKKLIELGQGKESTVLSLRPGARRATRLSAVLLAPHTKSRSCGVPLLSLAEL